MGLKKSGIEDLRFHDLRQPIDHAVHVIGCSSDDIFQNRCGMIDDPEGRKPGTQHVGTTRNPLNGFPAQISDTAAVQLVDRKRVID